MRNADYIKEQSFIDGQKSILDLINIFYGDLKQLHSIFNMNSKRKSSSNSEFSDKENVMKKTKKR